MKLLHKITLILLLAILMLPVLPAGVSGTAAGEDTVITYGNPVIMADAGQTIVLANYTVQFSENESSAGASITWSAEEIGITDGKITPDAAGLYRLTAKSGNKEKNVYLSVKEPGETEYVLYYNDFSSQLESDVKTVQLSSGASVGVSNGRLILDASNSASSYIRLLFPSYLSDFADYNIETSATMTSAVDTTKWMSIMFRIRNSDYPYWQFCLRQNMTASNGTELAERTAANAWSVTHTAAYSEAISSGKFYTYRIEAYEERAATYVNGTRMHIPDSVSDNAGAVGLQVRGCRAEFDYIKVTVRGEKLSLGSTDLYDVKSPASNIILTPTTATYVESEGQLSALASASPATAIFRVDKDLSITNSSGKALGTVEKAIEALNGRIIPGFYVTDKETVAALCAYLRKNNIIDALVVSSDPELVKSARTAWKYVRGAVDFTGDPLDDLYSLRETANEAGARIIILPAGAASGETVEYLQRLLMTVWIDNSTAATKTDHVRSITSGAYGIISSDIAGLHACFTDYFKENTAVRPIVVIGHRGVPTLAQENSIAGSSLAYELGATMVETDIYLTTDGVIFAMHDGTLDRTTDAVGATESVSSAMLEKIKIDIMAGLPTEPVPLLEDYFKEFKGKNFQILVEIKTSNPKIIEPLAELIEKYDIADQVNVIAFSEAQMKLMKQKMPSMSVGYLSSSIQFYDSEPLVSLQAALEKTQTYDTTFNPSYSAGTLGPNFIEAAVHRGMLIFPWTFRNQTDLDKYIMYGVSVSTDYTQYITDYVKSISAPSDSVGLEVGGTLPFPITKITYGRAETEISNAEMLVIESSGDINVDYSRGVLSAEGNGETSVIFRISAKTTSGQTYFVSTQPVTITVGDTVETATSTETQPPEKESTAPVTDEQDEQNSGVRVPAMLIIIAAVVVIGVVTTIVILTIKSARRR